jgi:plasmid maintenance system killer protein
LIQNFGNKTAADLFHKGESKSLPRKHWQRAIDLLDVMEAVESLSDLKTKGHPPSLRLHPLQGSRKGDMAIDIHKTDGWRITFRFEGNEFVEVKIENYH